jgi:hypothetical protein
MFEHRDKQAFPKPAGTEEKQIPAPKVFYFLDEHAFIDKIVILCFNRFKTAYPVRYLFHLLEILITQR